MSDQVSNDTAAVSRFIDNFQSAVDFQEPVEITAETELASLAEWDSLAALGVIVMFDMEYGKSIADLFALLG